MLFLSIILHHTQKPSHYLKGRQNRVFCTSGAFAWTCPYKETYFGHSESTSSQIQHSQTPPPPPRPLYERNIMYLNAGGCVFSTNNYIYYHLSVFYAFYTPAPDDILLSPPKYTLIFGCSNFVALLRSCIQICFFAQILGEKPWSMFLRDKYYLRIFEI